MFNKLQNVLDLINNAYYPDIKTVMKNNEYEKLRKYCQYAKSKKNKGYFYYYLGCANHFVEKNYEEAKKYYYLAVDKGNSSAMSNLAYYYSDVEKNYEECKKYYGMAIDKGDSNAMNNLAYYYHFVEKNYEEAKKYYGLAIDKGHSNAMYNLAHYYENVEKNYEEAKKYYLLAANKGDAISMNNLEILKAKIKENHKTQIKETLANLSSIKNINQIQHNECCICKSEYNITIGFNCLNKHNDHNYCHGCAVKWYTVNQLKCLMCTNDIVCENLSLNIKL